MLKNLTNGVNSAVHSSIDSISQITKTPSTVLSETSKTLSSNPILGASKIVSETLKDTTSKIISSPEKLITDASKVVSDTLTDASKVVSHTPTDALKVVSNPLLEVPSVFSSLASNITSSTIDLIPKPSKILSPLTNTLDSLIDITNSATLIKTLGSALNPTLLLTPFTSLSSLLPSFLQNFISILSKELGLLITPLWNFLRRFLLLGLILLIVLIGLVIILMPLIIITSPIWVPISTFLFLIIAPFLSIFGFGIFVVCTLSWAYSYYKKHN
ncbi:hypothetical protein Lal_00018867 [Lupinus albus]|uniref:Putative oleosin n=1 Tax=Lupinus albus TaxID=3870 RepID=A0A6A4P1F3_LUPAL|nr:putative oleosin [Lupinus albus]KAF1863022.1 hypothetical protein Lal_00018867 [Lupinus albus]